ncbi:MAG: hypothetical protein R3C18_12255 [Planctomycetaceae bacterium]
MSTRNKAVWVSVACFAFVLGGCGTSPPDLPPAPVEKTDTPVTASSPNESVVQAADSPLGELPEPQSVAPGELSISANAEWNVPYVFKIDGVPQKPKLPKLDVNLAVQGGQSKDFLLAGNLRIDRAEANGQALRLDFNEYLERLAEMPPLRGRVTYKGDSIFFRFVYPGTPIDRITRLTGQFQAMTSGQVQQYSNVRYSEFAKLAEDDPHLKAVDFEVSSEKSEFLEGESYLLSTSSLGVITDIRITNADGSERYDTWDVDYLPDGSVEIETSAISPEVEAESRISFSLHTDLKQVTLPFDLKDIPIAPLKERPAPELEKTVVFVPSQTNQSLPEGLRMDASIEWGRDSGGIFGSPSPLTVKATIEISGSTARKIETVESVTVARSVSDRGDLPLDEKHKPFGVVRHTPLIKIGRHNTTAQGRPAECHILFAVPEEPLSKVLELSGEVAAHIVEEREVLKFPDLQLTGTHVLAHPTLDQMGISLTYTAKERKPDDDYQRFDVNVKASDRSSYASPILLYGDDFDVAAFHESMDNGSITYFLSMPKKTKTATLQLEVYTQSRLEVIPFQFLDLDIPSKPEEKK